MKFVRFNGGLTGLLVESDGWKVVDVMGTIEHLKLVDHTAATAIASVLTATAYQPWVSMIENWDDVAFAFRSLNDLAVNEIGLGFQLLPLSSVRLDPPLASPTTHILSFGSNTVVHVQRAFKSMKDLDLSEDHVRQPRLDGQPPSGFTVWPESVIGQGGTVVAPRGTRLLDYEGECAVYLRRGGRNLDSVEIWGYTAWNDFGIRDTHLGLLKEAPWIPYSLNLPKNFDSGNACGPWVVVDEGFDLRHLRCVVKVNGQVRQDWSMSDMIYPFEDMFIHASSWVTMRAGDMVTSGTGAGVAIEGGVDSPNWLKPGDVVELELDGAGTLRNVVGTWDAA